MLSILFSQLMNGQMMGGQWTDVSVPNAAFSWLPFTVQQSGSSFRAPPTFSLQTQAAINPVTTYYLNTVSGSDSNSGLTRPLAKATMNSIITAGNATAGAYKVVIETGSTLVRPVSSLAPTQNVEVIGEGTVNWNSSHTLGAWSLVGGRTYTYQASVTNGELIALVYDEGTLNAYGLPTLYTKKTGGTGIADVEATAGSYYWTGGTLYVHTLDGSSPSGNSNLKYYDTSAIFWAKNNRFYFENINFVGGATYLTNASSAGGAKAYFKNCTFYTLVVAGLDEVIFQNCTQKSSNDDGCNYDILNTRVTHFIEIACDFGRGGLVSTNQASTSHNGSYGVRIGGTYRNVTGQAIADVGAGYMWLAGCTMSGSGTSVAYHTDNGTVWLDSCTLTGNLTEAGTGTIYKRNSSVSGTESGNITTY